MSVVKKNPEVFGDEKMSMRNFSTESGHARWCSNIATGSSEIGREKKHNVLSSVTINPFTPKSDQLQFSHSVSHQRFIIQYGEFGSR